ncbi:MAG: cobalt ECF transporter T component CbiQ [Methanothrix sp.]|nr:MAG: cobalt ECF transporter T component CbiQ [Methanothrix sp.]
MIPEWMKEVDINPCACSTALGCNRNKFVKKTLDGIFTFFQEIFVTESFAKRDGFLQSLDPRVKLISTLALVFSLSVTRDLRVLVLIYLLTLLFAYISNIGIPFFIKRVWFFIPIFTGVIAIPMMFNVFLPGDVLYPIANLGSDAHIGPIGLPESIYITKDGVMAAIVFTFRVAACVSAVVLLFLTTPQQLLFKSLRSVGVPKVYVLTIDMAYRYIFLFMDMIRGLYMAKKSRTIRSRGTIAEQKWVGGRMGYMLIKSLDMSEKVHMAMISRGFNGEVKIMHDFHMDNKDYMVAISAISFSILLLLIAQNIIQI